MSTCTTSVCVHFQMCRRGSIGHGATLFILWIFAVFVDRQRSLRCKWGWGIERQRWNAASFIIIISFYYFCVGLLLRSLSLTPLTQFTGRLWLFLLLLVLALFSCRFSKSLCNLLRVKSIFPGLLLSWSMFCWFGCYSRSSLSVSSSTSLKNSLMSSSHLFFGLPIALLVLHFDLNSVFPSAAFINHLSLGEVAILIAGLHFIDC